MRDVDSWCGPHDASRSEYDDNRSAGTVRQDASSPTSAVHRAQHAPIDMSARIAPLRVARKHAASTGHVRKRTRPARAVPRAHHFRRLISLSVSISRSRSARMRLSFAFSPSSVRSRLISVGSRPAKMTTPVVDRLLADPVFSRDIGDRRLVGLSKNRHHLFFTESNFLHGLLAYRGSHSLKLSAVLKTWAGQDCITRKRHLDLPADP